MDQRVDLIVVGGGLAGLAAASFAARAGLSVLVLERSANVGGMARTREREGFRFNLGPRALYPPAARILHELGVRYTGRKPVLSGYALVDGRLHAMPRGVEGLFEAPLFGGSGARAARALAELTATEPQKLDRVSLATWAAERGLDRWARELVFALVRLASYIDAPDLLSAASARTQLVETQGDVRYLDHGWQTLVEGLVRVAEGHGVRIRRGARAVELEHDAGGVSAVRLADGERIATGAVVLAVAPRTARALLAPAHVLVPRTTPVRAAVLDVALNRLPNREGAFLVSVHRPLYLSVHSLSARLAPGAGAVIHVARYLGPALRPPAEDVRAELEETLDRVQPGWQKAVVQQRFLPNITVTHALPTADSGGLSGRPEVRVKGARGVFLAGDWVGSEHLLAAAALASARRAATLVLRHRTSSSMAEAV